MCRKLQLELNEIHDIILSKDKAAIAAKITELYNNYDSYGKNSKKIIDRYSLLAIDVLSKL